MKQREILFLLGAICILVFAWIAFSILHNSYTSTLSQTTMQSISPIDPTFDTKTINALKKRTSVNPAFTIQVTPTQETIITPATTTPIPLASLSGSLASPGGKTQ
ncbi:MAG TPA: hypothetical protein VN711_03195 [Candidatus Saccharimonadales bacterium]|nr:hypothetical protein [Candidatus Saccharimonadales bacterium]